MSCVYTFSEGTETSDMPIVASALAVANYYHTIIDTQRFTCAHCDGYL